MKTLDGGLHWETISPDLTGAARSTQGNDEKPSGPPTLENAKRRGYGVVFTIAPSALNRGLIWAGSDTGLIYVTRDGGKSWKEVSPPGLTDWSKISLIEASHFDPAVAYAAVDRSRLDDQTPYFYRTRDYGATWQLITTGIAAPAFARAIREDTQCKGLLFAGTESGVYVSFDDGDHWQSLQLNLPVTSIRDLAIHGDDLVVATHGRSFWILDDIAPLRQANQTKANAAWLFEPAAAFRIDNDSFPGTPLPPEEPTAENPPNGAMIDYYLNSAANEVKLEILDAQQNLVRRFSSADKRQATRPPLPIAERWFPKPEVLEKIQGMHRFVWDLTWSSSGGPSGDEDSEFRNPSGPKAVPGIYQVRLTVDGRSQNQTLRIAMDPRSAATAQTLQQQLHLGQTMYGETLDARRAIAEISSLQKQIADVQQKLDAKDSALKSALADAQAEINKILVNKAAPADKSPGLQEAYAGVTSALRVVEGGERAAPSQAITLYEESSHYVKVRIAEWETYKQARLPALNQKLQQEKMAPIVISEIEQEVEFLMSR